MVFMVSSPFLSILLASFVIGTEKDFYFLLCSFRLLKSPSNSLVSFFMLKW